MAGSPAVPSAFTRSFRAIGLAVGAALVFTFYLAVDLGGTVRGVPRIESAIVAAVWVGPFLIYAAAVRTAWMAVLGGVALLAPTAGFLVAMFASTSSTSAIGMITVPMLTYPLAVIVWGLDRVLLAWTSGDRSRVSAQLAVCSVLVGAVAALFGRRRLRSSPTRRQATTRFPSLRRS